MHLQFPPSYHDAAVLFTQHTLHRLPGFTLNGGLLEARLCLLSKAFLHSTAHADIERPVGGGDGRLRQGDGMRLSPPFQASLSPPPIAAQITTPPRGICPVSLHLHGHDVYAVTFDLAHTFDAKG